MDLKTFYKEKWSWIELLPVLGGTLLVSIIIVAYSITFMGLSLLQTSGVIILIFIIMSVWAFNQEWKQYK